MRISSTFIALVGCTLVLTQKSSNTNVEPIINEDKNDSQYFNNSEVRVNSESNVVNNLLEIAEYDTILGNTFGKIGQFIKQIYNVSVALSENSVSTRKFSMEKLTARTKIELLTAIKALQSYKTNSLRVNKRRRNLFRSISKSQQKLGEEIGYLKRLSKIDSLIEANHQFLNSIAKIPIEQYGFVHDDFETLENDNRDSTSPSKSTFRVIEALGHLVRDWSNESEYELNIILKYVKDQLEIIIPVEERAKTVIIVPGSGLGRVAHEIAEIGKDEVRFGSVHAVEYSGIMHICNKFIYSMDSSEESQKYFPFIHSFSNHLDESSQLRPYHVFPKAKQPSNLVLHCDDFLHFEIPHLSSYENVVVVSVFFIDTASNMLEYFDRLKYLTVSKEIRKGFWLNVGPLKYGSSPRVEFNYDEINEIKSILGWKDLNRIETARSKKFDDKFVGYTTDRQSLWQAFYSVCMWTSARIENVN